MLKFLSILFLLSTQFDLNTAYAQVLPESQICRAVFSTIMNEKLEDVEFTRDVKQVKYIKIPPSKDNSTFKFKCTVTGNKIAWASELGSWRNSDLDSSIVYAIKEDVLTIAETYNSGYTFRKRFNLNEFDRE